MKSLRTGLAGLLVAPVLAIGLVVGPAAQPAAAFQVDDFGKALLEKGTSVGGKAVAFGRFIPGVGTTISVATAAWAAYDNRDALLGLDFGTICSNIDLLGGGLCTLRGLLNKPGTTVDPETGLPSTGPNVPGAAHPYGWTSTGTLGGLKVDISQVSPTEIQVNAECTDVRYLSTSNQTRCVNTAGRTFRANTVDEATEFLGATLVSCSTGSGAPTTRRWSTSYTFAMTFGTQPGNVPANNAYWKRTGIMTPCLPGEVVHGVQIAPKRTDTYQQFGLALGSLAMGASAIPDEILDGALSWGGSDVTANCRNGVTGAMQSITASSNWSPSDQTGVLPSCKGRLGADWYTTGVTVAPTKPKVDGEPIPEEVEIPDFVPDEWTKEYEQGKPDWQPCETDGKGCSLGVWIDNNPCTIGAGDCVRWTTVLTQTPTRVTCKYGTRTIEARHCLSIPYAYDPTTTTPTTGTGTGAQPPGTSIGNPPATLTEAEKKETGECFPSGWSVLNPIEWVYKPVKCALTWAFKPQTSLQTRLDRMTAQLDGRAPFSWIAALGDLPSTIGGAGCPTSWAFNWDGQTYSLLCGTPVEGILRGARPVFLALGVAAAVYPLLRSLWYAAFPVVKPSPT